MSLIPNIDSVRLGLYRHIIPQQSYNIGLEALEANCIQRAANSKETDVQRMQRQQAVIGSQLQRIDECLNRTENGKSSADGNDRPQSGLVVNSHLQGIGSQFDGVSGPNPKSHGY